MNASRSAGPKRTDDDLPPTFVIGGTLVLLVLLAIFLQNEVGLVGAVLGSLLVLLFGFLFVTVSSRLTGEIGSSSNPISGMTVATLLLTCLIFLALGMRSPTDAVLALSIGGVVCIAASNGGTTSQDLKTGYLVGGTPRWQQWAIIIGALTSALVIGFTLLLFNSAGAVYSQRDLPTENLKDRLASLHDVQEYNGETYHVWKPGNEDVSLVTATGKKYKPIKSDTYLVDSAGQVCYRVDPSITGVLKKRDEFTSLNVPIKESLTAGEVERLDTTVSKLQGTGQDASLVVYRLWNNTKPKEAALPGMPEPDGEKTAKPVYRPDVPEGEYLVDGKGAVVDKVDSEEVKMKFEAPKTQVMGIIINGLLDQKLNWTLVLIGAFIAVTLELCGVSSLAFAVGVYIPMQYTTPIFLGGLARWGVDAYAAYRARSAAAAAASEDAEARAAPRWRPSRKAKRVPEFCCRRG